MPDTDLPDWICNDCAKLAGGSWFDGHLAGFHTGTCGVCRWCSVTEPRDWNLLRLTPAQWAEARKAAQQRKGGG